MKQAIQYLSDANGNHTSVLLPMSEWEKIKKKLKRYEQVFKLRADIAESMQEVAITEKSKGKKQTLSEFLNE